MAKEDSTVFQAIHDLATFGHLTPESDYAVRDALDLVSDEEKEEHDERVKREQDEVKESKDSDDDDKPNAAKATGATKKAS
jgi:Arc/MetJ-type ribon-helix-helix transcriptional regulator